MAEVYNFTPLPDDSFSGKSGGNRGLNIFLIVLIVLFVVGLITGLIFFFATDDDDESLVSGDSFIDGIYLSFYGNLFTQSDDSLLIGYTSCPVEFRICRDDGWGDFDVSDCTVTVLSTVSRYSDEDFDIYIDVFDIPDDFWVSFYTDEFWRYRLPVDDNSQIYVDLLIEAICQDSENRWELGELDEPLVPEDVNLRDYSDDVLDSYFGFARDYLGYFAEDFEFPFMYYDFWYPVWGETDDFIHDYFLTYFSESEYFEIYNFIVGFFYDYLDFEEHYFFSQFQDFTCLFTLDGSDDVMIYEDGTFYLTFPYYYFDTFIYSVFSKNYDCEYFWLDYSYDFGKLSDLLYIHVESPDGSEWLDIPFSMTLKVVCDDYPYTIYNFDPDGDFLIGDTFYFTADIYIYHEGGSSVILRSVLNEDGFYDWDIIAGFQISVGSGHGVSSGNFDGWYGLPESESSSGGSSGDSSGGSSGDTYDDDSGGSSGDTYDDDSGGSSGDTHDDDYDSGGSSFDDDFDDGKSYSPGVSLDPDRLFFG